MSKALEVFEVWTLAQYDFGDSISGGVLVGIFAADTWEDACRAVFENHVDPYWNPEKPTYYWKVPLQRSREDAFKNIDPKHPRMRE